MNLVVHQFEKRRGTGGLFGKVNLSPSGREIKKKLEENNPLWWSETQRLCSQVAKAISHK